MFSPAQLIFWAQMLLRDECAECLGADWGNYANQTNFLDIYVRMCRRGVVAGGPRARGRQRRQRCRRAEGNQKRDAPAARGAKARPRSNSLARGQGSATRDERFKGRDHHSTTAEHRSEAE